MYPAVNQLIDIRGLDPAPWWPPAPGWWLIAAALILSAYLWPRLSTIIARRPPRRPRWQRDAQRRLHSLRRRARNQDAKETAGELSELIRRIAMAKYGRVSCAGLAGQAWLGWLEERDPAGFAWREQGRVLLDLPYAPAAHDNPGAERLEPLIDATLIWAAASKERKDV